MEDEFVRFSDTDLAEFKTLILAKIEKGKLFFFNTRGSVRLFDVHKRQKKELV
jgi:hypothetical protein